MNSEGEATGGTGPALFGKGGATKVDGILEKE